MKRALAILILFTHLLSGVGVFAQVHFCGDKITGWSFSAQKDDTDCSCKVVKKTDCCSDVVVESRVDNEATPLSTLKLNYPTSSKTIGLPLGELKDLSFNSTCLSSSQTPEGKSQGKWVMCIVKSTVLRI